jgi:hypothetical protein
MGKGAPRMPTIDPPSEAAWRQYRQRLAQDIPESAWEAWLRNSPASLGAGVEPQQEAKPQEEPPKRIIQDP